MQNNKKYRIAFGRFMHETNSFSPVETTIEDFKRTHYVEGQELLIACQPENEEVKGFLKNLELSGFYKAVKKHKDKNIELIPTVSAWSISGGPVAKKDFDDYCEKIKSYLKEAGELDGVFLALHGALGVTGEIEPEVKLIKEIRSVVGDIPIAVTMDLHANLSKEKIENIDIICAYRSNPHWDMARTGFRAGDILIKSISGEVQLTKSWRTLPMLLGGGVTIDFLPPMRGIFQRLKEIEQDSRVLYCSVFMCHPFLEHPELGWSVNIITDNNQELAESISDEIAERCWAVRKKMPPKFPELNESLEKIRKMKLTRKVGCIAVCDASDVVGAGGTGENTAILKELLDNAKDLLSLIPIRDKDVVYQLWDKNIGDDIDVVVGGKLQPEINDPVQVIGKLQLKKETQSFGKVLVLDLDNVKLVVTEGYALPMKPSFYEDLGLSTFKADIVVVKNFFHFRLYFMAKSRKSIYIKTKGITDLDKILEVKSIYPYYPKDDLDDWREIDKQKRGIQELKKYNEKPNKKSKLVKDLVFLGGTIILSKLARKAFMKK
jgi:microcystin degradation protein MlrC